jgi:hypothetical protein
MAFLASLPGLRCESIAHGDAWGIGITSFGVYMQTSKLGRSTPIQFVHMVKIDTPTIQCFITHARATALNEPCALLGS